jgi:hypothetical protein
MNFEVLSLYIGIVLKPHDYVLTFTLHQLEHVVS